MRVRKKLQSFSKTVFKKMSIIHEILVKISDVIAFKSFNFQFVWLHKFNKIFYFIQTKVIFIKSKAHLFALSKFQSFSHWKKRKCEKAFLKKKIHEIFLNFTFLSQDVKNSLKIKYSSSERFRKHSKSSAYFALHVT